MKIGDPKLEQAIRDAPKGKFKFKWVVNTDGDLGIIPHSPSNVEIHHSVIFNGGDVLSAGEGEFALDKDGNLVLESLDNNSGHYYSGNLGAWDSAYNNVGIPAFIKNGFPNAMEDFGF